MKTTGRAAFLAILFIAVVVSSAFAITISIDGTREPAWDGGGSITDADEGPITNNGVDIKTTEWTNDTTNYYFLFETFANTTWDLPGFTDAELILCINNDNNTLTGSSLPGQCVSTGYDRYVQIVGPVPTVNVFDASGNSIAATTDIAFSGTITELSVDLTSLGLDRRNCGIMLVGVYFDGQTADPDDNVADSSDVTMNCGAPTAVTLQKIGAGADNQLLPTLLRIGSIMLALISIGYLYYRRLRTTD